MPLKKDVACQKMIEFFLHHSQSSLLSLDGSPACGDIDQKRTIAPQQPRACAVYTHTHTLARLLLPFSFCGEFFLIPTGSRNFWASLSTIVLQVVRHSSAGLASFAIGALVDFTIQPVDKEIIQSWFLLAADTIISFRLWSTYGRGKAGLVGRQHANEEILLFFGVFFCSFWTGNRRLPIHGSGRSVCTSSWLRGDNNHPSATDNKKTLGWSSFFFSLP